MGFTREEIRRMVMEAIQKRAEAARVFLVDVVEQKLGAYDRGVWVALVRKIAGGDMDL